MRWDNESTTWMFFLNGINCILGWTAVLVSLDFFAQSFPAYNVCSYIALPLFSGYLLVAFLYHWISTRFRLRFCLFRCCCRRLCWASCCSFRLPFCWGWVEFCLS